MKSKDISPLSLIDKVSILGALLSSVLAALAYRDMDYNVMLGLGVSAVALIALVILFPSRKFQITQVENDYIVNSIKSIEENLNGIKDFVKSEEEKAKVLEDIVNSLSKEKEELEPVVNANRETVDSILKHYQKQSNKQAFKGYAISFVLGIISSLVATAITK
ncbi:hypothetical protein P7M43_18185 [Vibrio parahaemolyticus]|nr:hypothetical protein [Vibrio parahaemolyticus]